MKEYSATNAVVSVNGIEIKPQKLDFEFRYTCCITKDDIKWVNLDREGVYRFLFVQNVSRQSLRVMLCSQMPKVRSMRGQIIVTGKIKNKREIESQYRNLFFK